MERDPFGYIFLLKHKGNIWNYYVFQCSLVKAFLWKLLWTEAILCKVQQILLLRGILVKTTVNRRTKGLIIFVYILTNLLSCFTCRKTPGLSRPKLSTLIGYGTPGSQPTDFQLRTFLTGNATSWMGDNLRAAYKSYRLFVGWTTNSLHLSMQKNNMLYHLWTVPICRWECQVLNAFPRGEK